MRIESALSVRKVKVSFFWVLLISYVNCLISFLPPQTRGEFHGTTWLGFERLTCVPIQTRMVKEGMLTKEEKTWLKVSCSFIVVDFISYHERVLLTTNFYFLLLRTTISDVTIGFLLSLKRINELWLGLNERLSEI